jgi:hypothetical protein
MENEGKEARVRHESHVSAASSKGYLASSNNIADSQKKILYDTPAVQSTVSTYSLQ